MSHRSSVPSGAAPVILKGHVHLSKQWIKNHPKARKRGLSRVTDERTKKKKKKKTNKKNIHSREVGFDKEPL